MANNQSQSLHRLILALQVSACLAVCFIAINFAISLLATWHKAGGDPKEFIVEILTGDCGYINDKGNLLIDLRSNNQPAWQNLNNINASDFYGGRAVICEESTMDNKCHWLDLSGKQINLPAKAIHIGPLSDGFACFAIRGSSFANSHGYLDQSGNIALSPQWKGAGDFSEGLAPVCIFEKVKILDHWGYIDRNGKLAIAAIYHEAHPFSGGLAVVKMGTKYGAINKAGKEIIPTEYNDVYTCSEGMIVADKYKSKNIYANAQEIEDIDLERYYFDQNGQLRFTQKMHLKPEERTFGNFNKKHAQTIFWKRRLRFDLNSDPSIACGLAPIKVKDKYGYIDKTGAIVIAPVYDFAFSFSDGRAAVLKGGKIAFIDENGKQITDFIYKAAKDFSEGKAAVLGANELRWGFIDKSGNQVIGPRFSNAHSFSNGRALVGTSPKGSLLDH